MSFRIKDVHKTKVAILPDPIQDDGEIKHTPITMEEMQKKQNRGVVKFVGRDCDWLEVGDTVSFYRNAATKIMNGEEELLEVDERHVLAKLEEE